MTRMRVLITGGTGKVGRALAIGFAKAGWEVIVTSRSQERVDELVHELNLVPGHVNHGVVFEFASSSPVSQLVDLLRERHIQPHCLINNVRNLESLELGPGGRPPLSNWMQEFQLDVVVAYELTMELAAEEASGLENVINISSIYGIVAPNQRLYLEPETQSPIHYGVCKAALLHLTKELAVRLAPRRIRVNTLSYGGVEGRVSSDFLERYATLCPQGRMLTAADIAGPALFLAGAGASGMTGHNLVVDGGWSVW